MSASPTPTSPTPPLPDYEKLGVFYLGAEFDLAARRRVGPAILYDSKDLVTHAVCVGMTGSGKTGLCIGLIEEAAIDGIPSIIIDPKGDLSNLLLTFPQLRPEDFLPWVNAEDAAKKGMDPAAFAAAQAKLWAGGLADWGQDGARIQRLRDAAEFAVYTPGSTAGRQVSALRGFDAPPEDVIEDSELFGERVSSTVSSLLGLLGIDGDPLQSREHILLSNIFQTAWARGQSLDIPAIIQHIQNPPSQRIGVMEVESVFPASDRFALAMQLNNLIASPSFVRWTEGEPLDIGAMLRTPAGKPRVAIFSIAHLSDAERMFFVSLLLGRVLGWVRQQSGTTSLRALLYMDEIAGYFPPVSNPPSKQPLLTLMKQARAFGVGVVLATQNPVDIDYKGLSNAGTWFIGRLQTDRDKQRVLDGLEGAAATAAARFDRATVDGMLSQLGTRVFLMNNVHDDHPVIFETRWCMSYLRGPLTREQLKSLRPREAGATAAAAVPAAPVATTSVLSPQSSVLGSSPQPRDSSLVPRTSSPSPSSLPPPAAKPVLPPEIPQYFIPLAAGVGNGGGGGPVTYRPMLLGTARVYYADARTGVNVETPVAMLAPITVGPLPVDWDHATDVDLTESDLEHDPVPGATFLSVPTDAAKPKSYDGWKKTFGEAVYRTHTLELFSFPPLKQVSAPGESERDFRARLDQLAREQRDAVATKLRAKYAPKVATLQDRLRRAQQQVEVQKEQASSAKWSTALSFGSAVLGAFMGRKVVSSGNVSRAATAARGVSRTAKESSDIERAEENAESVRQQLAELEAKFQEELSAAATKFDPAAAELEKITLKPKKTGVSVRAVVLAWEGRGSSMQPNRQERS